MRPLSSRVDTDLALEAAGGERERLKSVDSVQAHGLLLALSEPALVVRQVSANALDIVGLRSEELLNRSVEILLGRPQVAALRSRLLDHDLLEVNPYRVVVDRAEKAFDCIAHRVDETLVLEFEPVQLGESLKSINVAAALRASLNRMDQALDITQLADVAANEVRRLIAFERVMIYRFSADWEGEVIADAAPPSAVSYLNLRFPASDTPAQVRRMFLVNKLRLIADVESLPVALLPRVQPHTGLPLDLTHAVLRSGLPAHIAYLRKLGVRAAMTLSIVVRGRLWGMIVCYHGEPRQPDYGTRATCDLIAQMFASQLVSRTDTVDLQARLSSRDEIEAYMTEIESGDAPARMQMIVNERLLALLDADGVVARSGNAFIALGSSVEEGRFAPLLAKLRGLSTRGIASSNMLGALDSAADSFRGEASGALYLGLSETQDDYIVLFRRELVATVAWADAPREPARPDDAPDVVQARTAFTAWQETVRGRCRAWTEVEIGTARLLREQFLRVRERQERLNAEERVRFLAFNDSLTRLANRISIRERLERCISRALADGSQLAVLFIDLDKFKNFNDAFGHATGDRILQIVAARLQHNVRAEDVVGRIGGDEFVVIVPGAESIQRTMEAAARLLAAIAQPLLLDHGTAQITASIGVSLYPSDATDLEALLRHSDAAMYDAKNSGRNAAEIYRVPDSLACAANTGAVGREGNCADGKT